MKSRISAHEPHASRTDHMTKAYRGLDDRFRRSNSTSMAPLCSERVPPPLLSPSSCGSDPTRGSTVMHVPAHRLYPGCQHSRPQQDRAEIVHGHCHQTDFHHRHSTSLVSAGTPAVHLVSQERRPHQRRSLVRQPCVMTMASHRTPKEETTQYSHPLRTPHPRHLTAVLLPYLFAETNHCLDLLVLRLHLLHGERSSPLHLRARRGSAPARSVLQARREEHHRRQVHRARQARVQAPSTVQLSLTFLLPLLSHRDESTTLHTHDIHMRTQPPTSKRLMRMPQAFHRSRRHRLYLHEVRKEVQTDQELRTDRLRPHPAHKVMRRAK